MDLPLALSVHRFVSSVGAYAGFASIIGLAILVLLFFAQARETSALRDHVDELLERIAGLEIAPRPPGPGPGRPRQAARPRPLSRSARRPRPSRRWVARGRRRFALPPAPPAGVGAPALSAATRVVPLGVPARRRAGRSFGRRLRWRRGGHRAGPGPGDARRSHQRVLGPSSRAGAGAGRARIYPAALRGRPPRPVGRCRPAAPPHRARPRAGAPRRAPRRRAASRLRAPAARRLGRLALIAVAVLAVGAAVAVAVVADLLELEVLEPEQHGRPRARARRARLRPPRSTRAR